MFDRPRLRGLPDLLEFLVFALGVTVSFGLDGWRHDRQQAKLHVQEGGSRHGERLGAPRGAVVG